MRRHRTEILSAYCGTDGFTDWQRRFWIVAWELAKGVSKHFGATPILLPSSVTCDDQSRLAMEFCTTFYPWEGNNASEFVMVKLMLLSNVACGGQELWRLVALEVQWEWKHHNTKLPEGVQEVPFGTSILEMKSGKSRYVWAGRLAGTSLRVALEHLGLTLSDGQSLALERIAADVLIIRRPGTLDGDPPTLRRHVVAKGTTWRPSKDETLVETLPYSNLASFHAAVTLANTCISAQAAPLHNAAARKAYEETRPAATSAT